MKQQGREPKRALIFDFDGTIADSLPAVIQVFETLTKRPQRFTVPEIESMRHLSLVELALELKVPRWKVPLLLFRGRRLIHAHMKNVRLHRGIVVAIQQLHERGEHLYILSSNSTENVQEYIGGHNLTEYFVGVYGGASLLGKAPRLNKLIQQEQINVAQSWYIGDETRDIIAAHAVGLRAMSVTWGYNSRQALGALQPDAIADTTKELLEKLA